MPGCSSVPKRSLSSWLRASIRLPTEFRTGLVVETRPVVLVPVDGFGLLLQVRVMEIDVVIKEQRVCSQGERVRELVAIRV